jgi:hypothetical protein
MRVKIVGDGTWTGTKVVDVETGEKLEGVLCVTWSCRPPEHSKAWITLHVVEIDVETEAQEFESELV